MKSLMRVAFLLAPLLFVIQCSSTKPIIRTIQTNADSTVAVELGPDSRGNGVILRCCKDACTVLTAAHLCNPDVLVDSLVNQVINEEISMTEGDLELVRYNHLLRARAFCSGFVVLDRGKKRVAMTPIFLDFERDLMLGVILLPGKQSAVHIPNISKVESGTELYTVVVAPYQNDKVVLFSRAGLTYRTFILDDPEKEKAMSFYKQTSQLAPVHQAPPSF